MPFLTSSFLLSMFMKSDWFYLIKILSIFFFVSGRCIFSSPFISLFSATKYAIMSKQNFHLSYIFFFLANDYWSFIFWDCWYLSINNYFEFVRILIPLYASIIFLFIYNLSESDYNISSSCWFGYLGVIHDFVKWSRFSKIIV